MSLFPNIKFEEIKYSHIYCLKKNEVPESSILEYKQDLIEPLKLAKLLISFANSIGD